MEEDQDHISQLPDGILRNILSRLKTREAVRTSSVSTRWRYLWTTPTNLVFYAGNMLEGNDYSLSNLHQLSVRERYIIMMKRSVSFVCSVNHFLSHLSEDHKIEKFKVYFTFNRNSYGANDLDHWVRFAIAREAEEVDLCLLEENDSSAPSNDELYVFPCDFLVHNGAAREFRSSLKCLRLAYCILAPSRYIFSCFRTITTLDLKKVNLVSDENIQNLLYNCHNIEWLSFSECLNINYLKIEHPFCLQLKYLNVSDCQQLKAIELKGINLETLEYKGCSIEIFFCNAPRLRAVFCHLSDWTASPGKVWPLLRLPINVPQLETLILECNFYFYMDGLMREKILPQFPNLRRLIILKVALMQEDLSWIATFLKACPALQRFELHLSSFVFIDEKLKKENWPSSCPHNHLKEVVISGSHGYMSEIAIAVSLLKNATSLERMTMDPRPRAYLGNGKWHVSEACEGWTTMAKERVHQHLIQEGCPPDKLLIL